MDKKDAIKCLKSMQQWIPDWDDREDGLSYWEAIDTAITALSQPNEPLTLDELREMDGEPVWIANPDALRYGRWGIVDGVYQAEDDQVLMLRGDYSCHYYGKTWLAYRRPPEGEDGTDGDHNL